MCFVKYPEIENTYRQKFIDKFTTLYPELTEISYIITEKIHGSNIQLIFRPHKPLKVASRNKILSEKEDFFGVWDVLEEMKDIICNCQRYVDEEQTEENSFRLFGEICGPKIQKGVYYGEERKILFFDAMIGDQLIPPEDFFFFQHYLDLPVVPCFDTVYSLQEALDFPTERPSEVVDPKEYPDNTCEGIVIKPYQRVYFNKVGQVFYLKKKNEKFKERQRVKKKLQEGSSEVIQLNLEFRNYITEERVQSIFSKEGVIQKPEEIGRYIKLVLEDAKKDFEKDFGDKIKHLEKKKLKKVFNVGSQIVKILDKYL